MASLSISVPELAGALESWAWENFPISDWIQSKLNNKEKAIQIWATTICASQSDSTSECYSSLIPRIRATWLLFTSSKPKSESDVVGWEWLINLNTKQNHDPFVLNVVQLGLYIFKIKKNEAGLIEEDQCQNGKGTYSGLSISFYPLSIRGRI